MPIFLLSWRLPQIQPPSEQPYSCNSVTPYMSSKRCHCSGLRGAELQDIKRSDGTSFAVMPRGSLSSMLMTVGTPAAKVISWVLIQSKKRRREKRFAKCRVNPVTSHGIRLVTWGEHQPKDRYSRVRSSAVMPSMSISDRPLAQ